MNNKKKGQSKRWVNDEGILGREEGKLPLLWLSTIFTSIESSQLVSVNDTRSWPLEQIRKIFSKITKKMESKISKRIVLKNIFNKYFQQSPLQSRAASLCLPMTPGLGPWNKSEKYFPKITKKWNLESPNNFFFYIFNKYF